jgi:hypothetical protein
MHLTLSVTLHATEGQLTLTTDEGRTLTFTADQTLQQQVCLVILGVLTDTPKAELAHACGYATKKSFYDHRDAVLHQPSATLGPKKRGPHGARKRTPELEAFVLNRRATLGEDLYSLHHEVCAAGYAVGVRLVSQILADHGVTKKKR